MSSKTTVPTFAGHETMRQNPERKHDVSAQSKVHTLTACCRCRQRKTRCDAGLPRCGPCERSNKVCEYYDSVKGITISRSYVTHLQNKIQVLEAELAHAVEEQYANLDAEVMMRSAGLVRFKQHDEGRYLGASSGIAMTRLVMELAKQNTDSKSIKEVIAAPDRRFQVVLSQTSRFRVFLVKTRLIAERLSRLKSLTGPLPGRSRDEGWAGQRYFCKGEFKTDFQSVPYVFSTYDLLGLDCSKSTHRRSIERGLLLRPVS